jgi:hypothetical protein
VSSVARFQATLEMLELEGRAVADKMHLDLKEMANNAGLGDVWDRINNGYVEMTPSGGIHWLYRIDGDGSWQHQTCKKARREWQH